MQFKIKILFEGEIKMKKKLILLLTVVLGTLGLVALRTELIMHYTDFSVIKDGAGPYTLDTGGFYKTDAGVLPIIFAVLLIAVVAFVLIFVFFVDKSYPGSPRLTSPTIICANFLYSAFLIVYSAIVLGEHNEDNTVLVIMILLLAVYMSYYAVCMIMKRRPFPIAAIIPTLFFCYKLLIEFLDSFSIIKTAEVLIDLAAIIFSLLFFTYFARYTSKTKFRASRKAFVAFGACAVILLCVNVLPYLFAESFAGAGFVRAYPDTDASFMIATALYIFVFVCTSLAKPELYRNPYSHGIDSKTGTLKQNEEEYKSARLELK